MDGSQHSLALTSKLLHMYMIEERDVGWHFMHYMRMKSTFKNYSIRIS